MFKHARGISLSTADTRTRRRLDSAWSAFVSGRDSLVRIFTVGGIGVASRLSRRLAMSRAAATTIVCASDRSEGSRQALDTALELAALYKPASVHVLYVHEVPERLENLEETAERWEQRRRALRGEIEEEIAKLRAEHPDLAPDVRCEVLSGKAYREILKYVLQVNASIVVVGTHGRTGLKLMLLGSVAERVVRHAPCTVVVAKPADVRDHLEAHLGKGPH